MEDRNFIGGLVWGAFRPGSTVFLQVFTSKEAAKDWCERENFERGKDFVSRPINTDCCYPLQFRLNYHSNHLVLGTSHHPLRN